MQKKGRPNDGEKEMEGEKGGERRLRRLPFTVVPVVENADVRLRDVASHLLSCYRGFDREYAIISGGAC